MENTTQHHRLTISHALAMRLAKWLYKARMKDVINAIIRLCAFITVPLVILAPQFLLGILAASIDWKTGAVITWVIAWFYGRNSIRWYKRRKNTGNQHTYEGVPVDELVSFIMENEHFRRHEAMKRFGMSKKKHDRIAKKLESCGLLVRGENNSRILQKFVTREILVRQLRDKFPMRWSESGQQWSDKDSSFEQYLHDRDKAAREEQLKIERLQRKKKKLSQEVKEQEQQLDSVFTSRLLMV